MAVKCFSLGAAQEVTGSKHIFSIDDRMFMIDCGSFQGKRRESDEKNKAKSQSTQAIPPALRIFSDSWQQI